MNNTNSSSIKLKASDKVSIGDAFEYQICDDLV